MVIQAAPSPDKRADQADALIRREFAGLTGTSYLDVAARAPLPASAERAAAAMLAAQASGTISKNDWLALVERARGQAAARLGAQPEEIAFTKNASEGLNLVATALRLGPGDRMVTMSAIEHPNNILPWMWQAQEAGAELVNLEPRQGQSPEEAMISAIDGRTKLVAVTAVDFATGRRTDLAVLGEACRRHGAFLLVDGAQSSGVLEEDFSSLPVDGWATATQKGLLGLYGLGLLYVRREWAEKLRPASLARFSVELSEAHEAARPEGGFRLRDGAGRFEVGNHNYVALAALNASLDLLAQIGRAEVERRAVGAADALREGLAALGIPLLPVPEAHRSHILAIGDALGRGHDTADAAWVASLSTAFKAAGVVHSVRRGALRLSTHIHVLPETVAQVLDCAAGWRRG
jgi:cysteine desulfurase/selenocysteine lyase